MPLTSPFSSGLTIIALQEEVEKTLLRNGTGSPVIMLPGFPASHIGRRGVEVIWFNLIRLIQGGLAELSLDMPNLHESVAPILTFYVPTAIALDRAGFHVDFHHFDWRLSIRELGVELKRKLETSTQPVDLVAHSMGGLVVRAAIALGAPNIRRVVMLGTPNQGTLAAVQTLRGVNPLLTALAIVDIPHNADALALVCRSFPGLYHLLPSAERLKSLLKPNGWPQQGPGPNPTILAGVEDLHNLLAGTRDDKRFFVIAGANQRTVFDVRLQGDEFVYEFSHEGDGLVPLDWAEIPGAAGQTYYVEAFHPLLADNALVAKATAELLQTGKTSVLKRQRPDLKPGGGSFTDSRLRSPGGLAHELGALALSEIHNLLAQWTTVPGSIE